MNCEPPNCFKGRAFPQIQTDDSVYQDPEYIQWSDSAGQE